MQRNHSPIHLDIFKKKHRSISAKFAADRLLAITYLTLTSSLFVYLLFILKWSSPLIIPVSFLFVLMAGLNLFWNIGYGYTLYRRTLFHNGLLPKGIAAVDTNTSIYPKLASSSYPSVAIIVPSYRESLDSIQRMIERFEKIDYPKSKVHLYLCDDTQDLGHRNKAQEMCSKSSTGITFVTRDIRRGYKAGAINDVLDKIQSEYIICLDIDHLPEEILVKQLVMRMMGQERGDDDNNNSHEDGKRSFLMFPQYFRNEHENNISRATALQQKVDYLFDRFGRATTNSAFCVTTNWITRTETLRSIGGLDETTITEDLATGIVAHANNIVVDIIEDSLAYGITPSTLAAWRKQQYRWAYGTFHVARTLFRKYWKSLSLHQLFDYLQCITWYLAGPISFLAYIFPIASALGLTFLRIEDPATFLLATICIIAYGWFASNIPTIRISKSLRQVIAKQAIGLFVSDVYAKALFDNVFKRKAEFGVTDKRQATGRGESFRTILGILKFHLVFLSAGISSTLFVLGSNNYSTAGLDLISAVNLGWIWYNNFWIIMGVILVKKGR